MRYDVGNGWPVLRAVREHQRDQILEVLVIEAVRMEPVVHLPELCRLPIEHPPVEFVVPMRFLKRRVSGIEREENDSDGEQVGFSTSVRVAFNDFWRHMVYCSRQGVHHDVASITHHRLRQA